MAVLTGALTLPQQALLSNEPLVRAVNFSLIENGSVLGDIPFVSRNLLIANGVRFEGDLPTVDWVPLNDSGSPTTGTPKPYQESAYIVRNDIDVDRFLEEAENNIVSPRGSQLSAYMKSVAYSFNAHFINNNHVTGDKDAPVGLKYRIDNPATYGVRSENKIAGGGVDLRLANRTNATVLQFLELIDQLLWSVDSPDGTNVKLYMNEVMWRRFDSSLKLLGGNGGFTTSRDQFDRSIMMYKNAQIRDIGYQQDQSTRIIPNTEDAAGVDTGSGGHTSIYAVRLDMEHLYGWQFAPMQAKDLGLLQNGSSYRTHIDWCGGLMNSHTRSMARLHGVRLS